MTKSQHLIGVASEYMVASLLSNAGKEVFFPSLSQSRADLIYLDGVECKKVQVKTGTKVKTGNYQYEQVRLVSRNQKRGGLNLHYSTDEIDEFWIVGTHIWKFPSSMILGRTSLFLGSDNPDPKKRRRDYEPDDFIVLRGSWDQPIRTLLEAY